MRWCSWFRNYAASQFVVGSIPVDITGNFH